MNVPLLILKTTKPLQRDEFDKGGARLSKMILVVDDEADIRNLLQISLEEQGYSVLTAENGMQALRQLQTHAIDLAILDVMMPLLDGFNLIRKIRETSTLPVIFLTARAEDMDKILGLGLGADDYLAKPFSIAELMARVGAQLRRSSYTQAEAGREQIVRYGGIVLDKGKCAVSIHDEPIEVSAKEYRLLQLFLENPERVFTKRQIYQQVWDEGIYFDDNTVMVHISRLRNKLERDPQNPEYIKTIRGIGYKLHHTGEAR